MQDETRTAKTQQTSRASSNKGPTPAKVQITTAPKLDKSKAISKVKGSEFIKRAAERHPEEATRIAQQILKIKKLKQALVKEQAELEKLYH